MALQNNDNTEAKEWRLRLRFLADITFASAMTLMVFNIEIPNFGHITNPKELAVFLVNQLNHMWVYFIAFVVIAVYWMKHLEHYSYIIIVNQNFIWFQILFLASIMLMPFWNTYIVHFPENVAIRVFLSINMVLVGLFSYLSMHYASREKHRLIKESIDEEAIRSAKKQIIAEPLIAILAAVLAFVDVDLWDLAFILVPLLFILKKKLTKINYFNILK